MGERVFVFPATDDCSESEQSILSGNRADMCMQGLVGPVPAGKGWTMEGVQGAGAVSHGQLPHSLCSPCGNNFQRAITRGWEAHR